MKLIEGEQPPEDDQDGEAASVDEPVPEPSPPAAQEPPAPAPVQPPPALMPALTGLPSASVDYSAAWLSERRIDLQRFQSGKASLETEIDRQQTEFDADAAERERKHVEAEAGLLKQLKDMNDAIEMIDVAFEKARELGKA